MARKEKEPNRVDELLDELLEDCTTPDDILGESGLMKQINQTQVQLCIVHLMRNCMKYVPWKDRKAVAKDLKSIYQAATLAESEAALDAFSDKWDEAYPVISQIWIRHWENVIPIFDYPMEIRRVIYTTNAIESLNRSLRKVIKTKAVFPDEAAGCRLMYLAMNNISKKWNRPIKNWRAALSHFAILFPERFSF